MEVRAELHDRPAQQIFDLRYEPAMLMFLSREERDPAMTRNPDVLTQIVARVLAAGATEFEVEYKDGEEHVVAFNGALGVEVAAYRSDSKDGQELRRELYALKKKRRKIIHAGVEYVLRVTTFASFGEVAFRGTITRS